MVSGPASQIQVNVRTLTGETHIIETTTDSLVEDIKFAINEEMGVPMDQQRLIFAGRQLEDQRTMEDYGTVFFRAGNRTVTKILGSKILLELLICLAPYIKYFYFQ